MISLHSEELQIPKNARRSLTTSEFSAFSKL